MSEEAGKENRTEAGGEQGNARGNGKGGISSKKKKKEQKHDQASDIGDMEMDLLVSKFPSALSLTSPIYCHALSYRGRVFYARHIN